MTAFKFYLRTTFTPGANTLDGTGETKSNPLSVSQHDETHKYLYTKIENLTLAGLTDTAIATPSAGQLLLYDGADSWDNKSMSGDGTLAADGALTISKLNGKTVTLANSFITSGDYSLTLTTTGATNVTLPTAGTLLTNALTSTYMFVGSAGGVATGVTISGAIHVAGDGTTTLQAGVVSNSHVNASAAIALTKLATVTASRVLVSDGSGYVSASSVTATTLGYLDATSSIQTQFNGIISGGTTLTNIDINSGAIDGVTLGTNSAITNAQIDNININGNTISSTSGDINITPLAGEKIVLDGHWEFDGTTVVGKTDNNTTITAYTGKNITIEGVTFDGGVIASVESLNMALDKKINFGTGGTEYIFSDDAGHLDFVCSTSFDFKQSSGGNVVMAFEGGSANGEFKWMEDEDYFEFSDNILMSDQKYICFEDENNKISCDTNVLTIESGGSIVLSISGGTFFTMNATTLTLADDYIIDIPTGKTLLIKSSGGVGEIALGDSGDKLGFFGATPVVRSSAYTFTNHTDDRSVDCDGSSTTELADALGSVILDLINLGILQGTVS